MARGREGEQSISAAQKILYNLRRDIVRLVGDAQIMINLIYYYISQCPLMAQRRVSVCVSKLIKIAL